MTNSASITPEQLQVVLLATELGSNTRDLKQFSYAEKGSSTYSFGLLQFDVGKNGDDVQQFLKGNGFNDGDIAMLSKHGGLSRTELDSLDTKLQAIPQDKVDQFTNQQLGNAVARVGKTIDIVWETNPAAADAIAKSPELQLAIADYDNQFHISDLDRKHPSTHGFVAYLEGKPVPLSGGTVKASDPLTRENVRNFIDVTKYGHDKANAHAVDSRAERLDDALRQLGLSDLPSAPGHAAVKAGRVLEEHAHGTAVQTLQSDLAILGYKDAHRHALKPDGDFGANTRDAVETFQRDHHLKVDGKVGNDTQTALQTALQARTTISLDDPRHADHPMYQQSLVGVHHAESERGIASGLHSERVAAALVAAAKSEGITHINRVLLSERGDRVFVEQKGSLPGINDKIAFVDTNQAIRTTVAQSTAAAAQVNQKQLDLASNKMLTQLHAVAEHTVSDLAR